MVNSVGVVSLYRRYQAMHAARQQNPDRLSLAHLDVPVPWLSIDGLPPEKGHATFSAVRELPAGRVVFAPALLSRGADEVRR